MKHSKLIAATLMIAAAVPAAAARRRASIPPLFPPCSMVTGTGAVTFSRDGGRSFAPNAEGRTSPSYTYGLAVLDDGRVLAWHRNDLITSTDAGCSWRVVSSFSDWDFPPSITPAKGGRAYAWSDNRQFLVRYDSRGAVKLKSPDVFVGLGVNPDDGTHLRAGSSTGQLWESHDAGDTWSTVGTRLSGAERDAIFYRFAFDPTDLDHVVAGMTVDGGYYTYDGGRTWRKSAFGSDSVNVMNFAISPVRPENVWAMAIDMRESAGTVPGGGKHIYLSTDGGATFAKHVDASADVTIVNQPFMIADPKDADVLWFVFGTYFQGYGTDIYRVHALTDGVETRHNDFDDVNAIAFSPSDPSLMYIGIETERGAR